MSTWRKLVSKFLHVVTDYKISIMVHLLWIHAWLAPRGICDVGQFMVIMITITS